MNVNDRVQFIYHAITLVSIFILFIAGSVLVAIHYFNLFFTLFLYLPVYVLGLGLLY